MRTLWNSFWRWYEAHLALNIAVASFLFILQLVHLTWLFLDVILLKLTGVAVFPLTGIWYFIILFVDYTEIPALVGTGLIYVNDLRKNGYNFKSVLFIFLLATQFLHLFWITDTFVVDAFTGKGEVWKIPIWLAWVAILIDYLELPVIYDTLKKLSVALKGGSAEELAKALKER